METKEMFMLSIKNSVESLEWATVDTMKLYDEIKTVVDKWRFEDE